MRPQTRIQIVRLFLRLQRRSKRLLLGGILSFLAMTSAFFFSSRESIGAGFYNLGAFWQGTSAASSATGTYTYTWPFDTPSEYTYDSSRIAVTGSYAKLLPVNQTDNSNASLGFAGGTLTGTQWNASSTPPGLVPTANTNELPNYAAIANGIDMTGNVLLLHLNETGSPTSFSDAHTSVVGSQYPATCVGAGCPTPTTSGKLYGAMSLNGTSNCMQTASIDFTATSKVTITMWVNASAITGTHTLLEMSDNTNNYTDGFAAYINSNGTITAFDKGNVGTNSWTSTSVVKTGSWYFVAFVFDKTLASETMTYINGVSDGALATSSDNTNAFGNHPIYIGERGCASLPYSGLIDEVAVHTRVLTAAEILARYNLQKGYYGIYDSRIMDTGGQAGAWNSLSWTSDLAYYKELPNAAAAETGYTNNFSMTGNVLLLHMNGSGNIANSTAITDSSGGNVAGTLNNANGTGFAYQTGIFNQAMNFDGVDDYIDFGNQLNMGLNSWSASVWFNTTDTDYTLIAKSFAGNAVGRWAMINTANGGLSLIFNGTGSGITTSGVAGLSDGNWHHAVGVWNRAGSELLYIDGILRTSANISSQSATNMTNAYNLFVGVYNDGTTGTTPNASYRFAGQMDEIAVFSRALSSTEVNQLYQRGVNRIKFQARSCAQSNCSDGTFTGPDSTANTYYTELSNSSAGAPTNIALAGLSANRYFQYHLLFDTDISTSYPIVPSVTIGPTHYDSSGPTIVTNLAFNYVTLTGFVEGNPLGTIKYQITKDGTNWYYYNGTSWTAASATANYAQTNLASEIVSNLSTIPSQIGTGNLALRIFLYSGSSAATQTQIDYISATGTNSTGPTITYSVSSYTFAQGTPITSFVPSVTLGSPITNCSITPSLTTNTGLSLSTTDCTISGTPTILSGAVTYTVSAGNSGGNSTATVQIAVTAQAPAFTYPNSPYTLAINTAISSILPSATGGPPTSCGIAPALPTGLALTAVSCAITGTPTALSSSTTYTVTATNGQGTGSSTLNITVATIAPTITYSPTTSYTYTNGMTILTLTPSQTAGSPITSCAISPNINTDTGLTFNTTTCAISGKPTSTHSATSYTVTATNSAGTSPGAAVSITVGGSNAFTYTWPLTVSTDYTFNATNTTVASGLASLLALNQTDSDNTATGFGGGTMSGTAWSSANSWLTLGTVGTSISASNTDMTSILGLWHFDGTVGNSIANAASITAANGSNGTASNVNGTGMAYSTGKLSGAVHFDGVDDYIAVPDAAALRSYPLTVMFWIKTSDTTATQAGIVSKAISGTVMGWQIYLKSGKVCSWFDFTATKKIDDACAAGISVSDGTWHHIAWVVDGTSTGGARTYLDGVLKTTVAWTGAVNALTNTQELEFGRYSGAASNMFSGDLDEIAIWGRVLSATEIQTAYSQQMPLTGTFDSRILNAGASSPWNSLAWTTPFAEGKELPNSAAADTGYTSTNLSMANNLVLLHMNGTVGAIANAAVITDNSGSGINGAAVNTNGTGMAYVAGKLNQGISFDGIDDYVTIPSRAAFNNMSALTISAWINLTSYATSGNYSFIAVNPFQAPGGALVSPYELWYLSVASNGTLNGAISTNTTRTSANSTGVIPLSTWTHVALVWDGSIITYYVNGVADSSSTGAAITMGSTTQDIRIGAWNASGSGEYFTGSMDEVGIWSRALSSTEMLNLYQRGAARVKFQVRTCALANCSDGTYKGPDNTSATYYSELSNSAASPPSLTLSASLANNQYFQYRAFLDTDAFVTLPVLPTVTVGPAHYDCTSPTVVSQLGTTYLSLATFAAANANGSATFQVSLDKTNWYYYNGSAWASATTSAQTSTAAQINTNAATLAATMGNGPYFYFKAFLYASLTCTAPVSLGPVTITGQQ